MPGLPADRATLSAVNRPNVRAMARPILPTNVPTIAFRIMANGHARVQTRKSRFTQIYAVFSDRGERWRTMFWRREWDSNPRYGCPYTRFPSVRLQPLGHPSAPNDVRRPAEIRRHYSGGPVTDKQTPVPSAVDLKFLSDRAAMSV